MLLKLLNFNFEKLCFLNDTLFSMTYLFKSRNKKKFRTYYWAKIYSQLTLVLKTTPLLLFLAQCLNNIHILKLISHFPFRNVKFSTKPFMNNSVLMFTKSSVPLQTKNSVPQNMQKIVKQAMNSNVQLSKTQLTKTHVRQWKRKNVKFNT